MTTHTPGPWNIHPHYNTFEPQAVYDKQTDQSWVYCHTYIAQGKKIIAQVLMQSGNDRGHPTVTSMTEMKANCQIIANAPQMFDTLVLVKYALDAIVDELQLPDDGDLARIANLVTLTLNKTEQV